MAFPATRVPQFGHSNSTPASTSASARMSSSADDPFVAIVLMSSKKSDWTSFPFTIEFRISSIDFPFFEGRALPTSGTASETSNRDRSVLHSGHRRASASIAESQTGQSFVSPLTNDVPPSG